MVEILPAVTYPSSALPKRDVPCLIAGVGEVGGTWQSLLPVSHQDLPVCRKLSSSASGCGESSQGQALWGCEEGGASELVKY